MSDASRYSSPLRCYAQLDFGLIGTPGDQMFRSELGRVDIGTYDAHSVSHFYISFSAPEHPPSRTLFVRVLNLGVACAGDVGPALGFPSPYRSVCQAERVSVGRVVFHVS